MIRKLRRQFILVAMLSTFAVLTVIIGSLNIANYISMTSRGNAILDLLLENNGQFPEFFMGQRVLPERWEETDEIKSPDFAEKQGKQGQNGQMPPGPEDGKTEEMPERLPAPGLAENDFREEDNGRRFGFSNETPYETRYFSVEYHPLEDGQYKAYTGRIAAVEKEEAVEFAKNALKKFQKFGKLKGNYGNYRYAVKPDENGNRLVVFVDMTKERNSFRSTLMFSLILSGVGLLAVYVLVYIFSKKVFRPVEESDKKQKRFITDASHELKTPLTIISANVEVLEMEAGESKWTESIEKQVLRMNSLVEQMVTLSKMDESDTLVTEVFDLSDAVEETANYYLPVAEKNGCTLELDIEKGIRMKGDEKKIRQMTGLLLDNSMKYATPAKDDPEGKPEIKLSLKTKGKKLQLVVWNTAAGIGIGNKDELFERFYRMDSSRNSQKGGSGIGLSIVKAVVDAHKGKISAYSKDGDSITFETVLPLN